MRDQPARVLIAGGGVAALEALLALRERAGERVETTLLAPTPEFTYRPLTVVEPFAPGSVPSLPLAEFAAEQETAFVRDALAAVEAEAGIAVTRGGTRLAWDELIIAIGARQEPVVPGAITFGDPSGVEAVARVVAAVRSGAVRRIALIVPAGIAWTLPLYELTLQLGAERDPDGRSPELLVVTAEHEPLEAFGSETAAATRELLGARGVHLRTASMVETFEDGLLWIDLEGAAEVDAAIALPRLRGPAVEGLSCDENGFLLVDGYGLVEGEDHVYAAGDACTYPLKQGGLAAQQSDVVAAHIAWRLGLAPKPAPFDPVLRALLITGAEPRFLRAHVMRGGEEHDGDQVAREPLWWPPAKIATRYLAPYLAERVLRTPAA